MALKLRVDDKLIVRAREAAHRITGEVQGFIEQHTTTSTERAVVRLFGVEGKGLDDVPLPNLVVENIQDGGGLDKGASYWVCNAMARHSLSAQEVAQAVGHGKLDLIKVAQADEGRIRETAHLIAQETLDRITRNRQTRSGFINQWGERPAPWLYIIVATGNIYEDVIQAQNAARQGADVIAVIRSTAQSLLDYVPEGATTEGFAGTYATQENFRIMRRALDEVSEELGRYIRLTNYASGLCMPEIAALGAVERLDMMLSDSMYGILFRDINMKRTLVDQHFARMIQAQAGIIINTGEDNYLTTDDAYEAANTVLASQFINEQFAHRSGMTDELIGLGHAFEMDPRQEDGLLYEMADALLSRHCFPKAPLKYMPPTRHMTGNIFMGHIMDAMFNLTSVATNQHIHLIGVMTEAIHTPFLHDRALAIENARYVFGYARHFFEEFDLKKGGLIEKRANDVLQQSVDLLEHIEHVGLMTAIAEGTFGRVRRQPTGGKGLDGVVAKGPQHFNPFFDLILKGGAH
ncbi:MAG: lysine 5,6-aminomutase alpha subunit [Symbiobacteriaceae bacterium]|jgi:beta-lysine 5,6-aminomutase alpha subunit|nr:lysine 5,6-aminomutase alpha subunit [Symbiobacteriaceae bacterium]